MPRFVRPGLVPASPQNRARSSICLSLGGDPPCGSLPGRALPSSRLGLDTGRVAPASGVPSACSARCHFVQPGVMVSAASVLLLPTACASVENLSFPAAVSLRLAPPVSASATILRFAFSVAVIGLRPCGGCRLGPPVLAAPPPHLHLPRSSIIPPVLMSQPHMDSLGFNPLGV